MAVFEVKLKVAQKIKMLEQSNWLRKGQSLNTSSVRMLLRCRLRQLKGLTFGAESALRLGWLFL